MNSKMRKQLENYFIATGTKYENFYDALRFATKKENWGKVEIRKIETFYMVFPKED